MNNEVECLVGDVSSEDIEIIKDIGMREIEVLETESNVGDNQWNRRISRNEKTKGKIQ